MIDALRIIAAKSPAAGEQAMQCIRAIQAKSPIVQRRYNRVAELAFGDNMADFEPAERRLIASYIEADEVENKSLVIRFRVTPSEKAAIEQMATDGDMDVSEFLRSLIWPD